MDIILDKNYKFKKDFLIYFIFNFLIILVILFSSFIGFNYLNKNQKDVTGNLMTGYFSVNEQLIYNNSMNIVNVIGIIEILLILVIILIHFGLDFGFLLSQKFNKKEIFFYLIANILGLIIVYLGFYIKKMLLVYFIYRTIIYLVFYYIFKQKISIKKLLASIGFSFLDILLYILMMVTIILIFYIHEIKIVHLLFYLFIYITYFIFRYYILNKIYIKKGQKGNKNAKNN